MKPAKTVRQLTNTRGVDPDLAFQCYVWLTELKARVFIHLFLFKISEKRKYKRFSDTHLETAFEK